ncbi:MAG: DUF2007 domain-containing protein [Luteimonas sp.]|nr:DUF2007 domain-containing protein [Luteimonas sp.]
MRQVFSSARLENVEAVAKLLADEGIEVRIENGRTFRSSIRGNFSYRDGDGGGSKPAVWVVRSDDQPRARQLLRDAGLLDAAPSSKNSFLPSVGHAAQAASPKKRTRMRFGLLVLVAIAIAVALNPLRDPGGWDLPPPRPAVPATVALDPSLLPVVTSADTAHLIPTPPALAAMLASRELARSPGTPLCLSIDGADPGEAALAALRDAGLDPIPASACPAEGAPLAVAVSGYRTDGSGSGAVEVEVTRPGQAPATSRLEVLRDEDRWQVLRTL